MKKAGTSIPAFFHSVVLEEQLLIADGNRRYPSTGQTIAVQVSYLALRVEILPGDVDEIAIRLLTSHEIVLHEYLTTFTDM